MGLTTAERVINMAYLAVQTKFLGPTNYRGDRIKATVMQSRPSWPLINGKRETLTVPYEYGKDTEEQHKAAAIKLLATKVWAGGEDFEKNFDMEAGACDRGWVFVPVRKLLEEE